MATLARACADNCGTVCPPNMACYSDTSVKGYSCRCFLNGTTPPPQWVKKQDRPTEMSTGEMYKSALLQSRQAANFVNPTNANFCYAKDMSTGSTKNICIAGGNQCPGCSLNNCCYKNTVLNECGCFAKNPGTGWIRQSVKSPDYKMEASLRSARENFSTPTNPTSQ